MTLTPTDTPRPTRTPTPGPSPTLGRSPSPVDGRIYFHDERLIIYARNDNLCALKVGDQPIYLADARYANGFASSVRVSSDGSLIAFVWRDPQWPHEENQWDALWVVGADGTNLRRVANLAELSSIQVPDFYDVFRNTVVIIDYEWLPDTHQIAFTTGTLIWEFHYHNDLNVVDADTLEVSTLLAPNSGAGSILLSPDGKKMALLRYSQGAGNRAYEHGPATISFINVDGSDWWQDVFSFEVTFSDTDMHYLRTSPVWTPSSDGIRIALSAEKPLVNISDEVVGWIVPADGSSPRIEFRLPTVSRRTRFGEAPALSPDGAYLALFGTPHEDEMPGLHIYDTSNLSLIQQDTAAVDFVSWEADSLHYRYEVETTYPQTVMKLGGIGEEPVMLPDSPDVPHEDCLP